MSKDGKYDYDLVTIGKGDRPLSILLFIPAVANTGKKLGDQYCLLSTKRLRILQTVCVYSVSVCRYLFSACLAREPFCLQGERKLPNSSLTRADGR